MSRNFSYCLKVYFYCCPVPGRKHIFTTASAKKINLIKTTCVKQNHCSNRNTGCIPSSTLLFIVTVIIEVYLQCFPESVSLRDIGKPTSRVEIRGSGSSYLKAVKGALNGSALTGATSE